MKVTIIPFVIGAFGTITITITKLFGTITKLSKGLGDLEVGGRVDTMKTTALMRTAIIL